MHIHIIFGEEMAYTLQTRFCKVDCMPVNVQCLNSTQDSTILMMVQVLIIRIVYFTLKFFISKFNIM